MKKKWDAPGIKAALERKGMTLTGIAKDAGLSESIARLGLRGNNRRGAQLIADALGVPFEELFPDTYLVGRHHRGHLSRNDRNGESAKRRRATDDNRGVA